MANRVLLHFNGADGSTIFTDQIGHIFSPYDNAQLSISEKKFGSASGLFDGTGDYIDTPDSVDFTIGASEFCMDAWIRCSVLPPDWTGYTVSSHGIDDQNRWQFHIYEWGGVPEYYLGFQDLQAGGLKWNPAGIIPLLVNTWHHVAVTHKIEAPGWRMRLFFDGIFIGDLYATTSIIAPGGTFKIGKSSGITVADFNGRIDEFRFTIGEYVWDSNFAPPTSEYNGAIENVWMRHSKFFDSGVSQGSCLGNPITPNGGCGI